LDTGIPYLGEIFALLAPLSWSFAVILFRVSGRMISPIPLNFFKNSLAILLFVFTAIIAGEGLFRDEPVWTYLLLLASGVMGIGLADMFFFMTLNRVGAGLQAIINTSYSPFIIFLSMVFLGERLTVMQLFGVAMILGAVLAVTKMKAPSGSIDRKTMLLGILFGVSASLTQAVSIVMIKPWLGEWPIYWANSWRMLGGLITMAVFLPLMPGGVARLKELRDKKAWPAMIAGAVLGTYISLIFWLAGMKYTMASVASSLNQTSTLFTFILAAVLLREPVTVKRILGIIAGMVGVLLVMFGAVR